MKKVRSNASWNRLTPKQRETLDRWLFEENLSYAVILPKAQSELGYKGSETSLRRYYERRRQERLLTDLKDVGRDMAEVQGLDTDADVSRKASVQVLGAYLFRVLRSAPEKVKEWAPVASLMLQDDRTEMLRQAKAREDETRRQALAFAKEKFEFDMMERALKALPELKELVEARKDPNLRRYEENVRRNKLRRAMFGPGHKVQPESAQEEAEMLAMKREREAKAAQQSEMKGEQVNQAGPPPPSSQYYEEYRAAEEQREAEERERERVFRAKQAQASAVPEAEQAEQKKSPEQQEAEQQAEREKLRKKREAQARIEEIREICGWQEVQQPPGTAEWGE